MNHSDPEPYLVRRAKSPPGPDTLWTDPVWSAAQTVEIGNFRPESAAHRPATRVRLIHDSERIYGVFHIRDQFVRSVRTRYFDDVWKDSCVEFFLQPRSDGGYFNLEMNAGGAHLCCFIEDPTRVSGGFKKFTRLPPEAGKSIQVRSSLPNLVDPEIVEPLSWELNFSIPFHVLERYVGPLADISGQEWRGNFFKCAEDVSHPHWASWRPVDEFNFHLPRCFGSIRFE